VEEMLLFGHARNVVIAKTLIKGCHSLFGYSD
jgi:hypothetical protein